MIYIVTRQWNYEDRPSTIYSGQNYREAHEAFCFEKDRCLGLVTKSESLEISFDEYDTNGNYAYNWGYYLKEKGEPKPRTKKKKDQ